jgi:hypothetical protein
LYWDFHHNGTKDTRGTKGEASWYLEA